MPNSYSGGTTIYRRHAAIGQRRRPTAAVTGNVVDNAALAFNNAAPQTYGGKISGGGPLVVLGAGSLALTGSEHL